MPERKWIRDAPQHFSKEQRLVRSRPDYFSFKSRRRIGLQFYLHAECFPLALKLLGNFLERRLVRQSDRYYKRNEFSVPGKAERIEFIAREGADLPCALCEIKGRQHFSSVLFLKSDDCLLSKLSEAPVYDSFGVYVRSPRGRISQALLEAPYLLSCISPVKVPRKGFA